MKKSVNFYKDIFGLQLKFETSEWTEFVGNGVTIALHKSDYPDPAQINRTAAGYCRPGFSVENIDAFHKNLIDRHH